MVDPRESERTPEVYSFVGMGVWLVRRQAMLVLLVGMLAGLVLTGVVASRSGLSGTLALRAGSFLGGQDTRLPARIEVAVPSSPAPGASSGPVVSVVASPSGTSETVPAPVLVPPPARAPVPVTVVPPPVYTYPADDHGGSSGGSGERPGGGGHH